MSSITKSEHEEEPIPSMWRPIIASIVDCIRLGDFTLVNSPPEVDRLNNQEAKSIADNIAFYGDTLAELPDETWKNSIYRWMQDHWSVLVDLYTVEHGTSDLVMHVRVIEQDRKYRFKVDSVHVP